ncbi:MAG: glycosyltransferase family 4 protein [Acidobacteria bacterium]|nr:glycosyltransferase family 4 protein [Acidobacteriota bacterium]MBI3425575.1 glycosyltransferase family 4 protein [Acidobacteriota bacterium]
MRLKIALVVHGRFHSFDLACALVRRGHDVTLLTNYPKWAVKRFGFPVNRVKSFWLHGVLTRLAHRLDPQRKFVNRDEWWHSLFGRWAAKTLCKEAWDVTHLWSGVAEEILQMLNGHAQLKILMRGSAHIAAQARLLAEETARAGVEQDHPSAWMIAREQREYALTDLIVTLSSFARDTFLGQGIAGGKVKLLPLGVNLTAFRPAAEVVEARSRRILSGAPLRVLYVGALSFQKGFQDLAAVIQTLCQPGARERRFMFRMVGPVVPEVKGLVAKLAECVEFVPKQAQADLPAWYAWADLFVFPTIQDGFAVVLGQAAASGLPILTTTNCGGPDILREGETGWILPIRDAQAFVERLRWCDAHREELAAMVHNIYQNFQPRNWDDVAADFEAICRQELAQRQ